MGRTYKLKVVIDGHELIPFDGDLSFEIRRVEMTERNYAKEIEEKTRHAEKVIAELKLEVELLADAGGVKAYWGEYGSGETYYPVGTNIHDEYIGWEASEYADENGLLTQGLWISSSAMC